MTRMKKHPAGSAKPMSTWSEIFDRVDRRGAVVLRRGERFYELRLLDDDAVAARHRQTVMRVPAGERRIGRASLDSPVVRRGFGWSFDPAGGGLRLVKPRR